MLIILTNVNIRLNNKEVFPEVYESDIKIYRKVTENGNVYLEVANSSKNFNEYEIVIYRAMEWCYESTWI